MEALEIRQQIRQRKLRINTLDEHIKATEQQLEKLKHAQHNEWERVELLWQEYRRIALHDGHSVSHTQPLGVHSGDAHSAPGAH